MMRRSVIFLFSLTVAACVSPPKEQSLGSISEALRLADIKEEKNVRLSGYLNYHFEGSSLEVPLGTLRVDEGIAVYWLRTPILEPLQPIASFGGKYVEVRGILRKGSYLGPRVGEIPFIELTAIKEANQPLQPTAPSRRG